MRIAFLAHLPPWPVGSGGSRKTWHTLKAIVQCAEVDVFTLTRSTLETTQFQTEIPDWMTGRAQAFSIPRSIGQDGKAWVAAKVNGASWFIQRDRSIPLLHALEAAHADHPYDIIWVDHLQMWTANERAHRFPDVQWILDMHNVEGDLLYQRASEQSLYGALAKTDCRALATFERMACNAATRVISIGEMDAKRIREYYKVPPERVVTFPPAVPLVQTQTPDTGPFLGFVGPMHWKANRTGLEWFIKAIWPEIRQHFPNAQLRCAGAGTDLLDAVQCPSNKQVYGLGYLPDLTCFWDSVHIGIAPLKTGSGIKVKLVESWGAGKPTIGTSAATVDVPEHTLFHRVADDANGWITAIDSLWSNPMTYMERTKEAITHATTNHAQGTLDRSVQKLLEQLVFERHI